MRTTSVCLLMVMLLILAACVPPPVTTTAALPAHPQPLFVFATPRPTRSAAFSNRQATLAVSLAKALAVTRTPKATGTPRPGVWPAATKKPQAGVGPAPTAAPPVLRKVLLDKGAAVFRVGPKCEFSYAAGTTSAGESSVEWSRARAERAAQGIFDKVYFRLRKGKVLLDGIDGLAVLPEAEVTLEGNDVYLRYSGRNVDFTSVVVGNKIAAEYRLVIVYHTTVGEKTTPRGGGEEEEPGEEEMPEDEGVEEPSIDEEPDVEEKQNATPGAMVDEPEDEDGPENEDEDGPGAGKGTGGTYAISLAAVFTCDLMNLPAEQTPPLPPVALNIEVLPDRGFRLTWQHEDPESIAEYVVYRGVGFTTDWDEYTTVKKTSFEDHSREAREEEWQMVYLLAARNKAGLESNLSDYVQMFLFAGPPTRIH